MGPQSPCAQGVRGGAGSSASLLLLRDASHRSRRGASRPTPRRHERGPCHYSDRLLGTRLDCQIAAAGVDVDFDAGVAATVADHFLALDDRLGILIAHADVAAALVGERL